MCFSGIISFCFGFQFRLFEEQLPNSSSYHHDDHFNHDYLNPSLNDNYHYQHNHDDGSGWDYLVPNNSFPSSPL